MRKFIQDMINNFKDVMDKIDHDLVEKWVYDLVIVKTFIGLKFQEAILKKVGSLVNKNYRLSTPEEESKGIDGYIGTIPISIKPTSYKTKAILQENIVATMIFYEKVKDDSRVSFLIGEYLGDWENFVFDLLPDIKQLELEEKILKTMRKLKGEDKEESK